MKNIRYYFFWLVDFFKGSPIRKHLKEIETVFYKKDEAKFIQQNSLSNILNYSVTHTEFYKGINPDSIHNFPVIQKTDISSNIELDSIFSNEFKQKRETLRTMSTSGSTGRPLTVYQDSNKVYRHFADLIFFYQLGNYYTGDKLYSMRIWTDVIKKPKRDLLKENFRMIDTSDLDTEGADTFVETMISDKRQKVILAYASSFTALINKLSLSDNVDWNIKSIFTVSEDLPLNVKRKMQELFQCPVMSRYANQENGILGQQPVSGEDYFELNEGSYFFEFLKLNSDEPADELEEARIVITDLFNRAVPIIRYDTGDIGVYTYKTDNAGNKRKVLKTIIGRKVDYLYSNNMKLLSPHTFTNLMWKYKCFIQFQLIQEDYDNLTLKLVYKENARSEKVEKNLINDFKQLFGEKIKIKIINLDNIPLEVSGKRKYIISKIKANL